MDKEQENEHKKPLPQLERHDSVQRSHDDDPETSTEAAAVPKRAQQRRRRNLSLNGEIDVEPASGAGGRGASGSGQQGKWLFPPHKNDQRRESWIDRLNETAIKAIRRTSGIVTATDEQHFVDKMAAMLNEYDDGKGAGAPAHGETWTDKVLDFLFPSLHAGESTTEKSNGTALEGDAAFSAPSDLSYDDVQSQVTKDDQVQWRDDARRAATLKNKPETKYNLAESARALPDAPDDAYDATQSAFTAPDPADTTAYEEDAATAPEHLEAIHRRQEEHWKDLAQQQRDQPPPQLRDHPPYDVAPTSKKNKRRRNKQKLASPPLPNDTDFENWKSHVN